MHSVNVVVVVAVVRKPTQFEEAKRFAALWNSARNWVEFGRFPPSAPNTARMLTWRIEV